MGGLLYLAAMSLLFGLLAPLLSWPAAPRWLWALVSSVSFGVGLLVSEFWFGWATEEDLQPDIDGLSRDEVLLIGLAPRAVAVVVTRWMARRTLVRLPTSTRSHRRAIGRRRRTHRDLPVSDGG